MVDVTATVTRGSGATATLPSDGYYVLTKTDSSLANSQVHSNTGAPNYDVRHLLSDLDTASGGQVLVAGSGSGDNLTLQSTSNATKGKILFGLAGNSVYDEANDRLGLNVSSPSYVFDMDGDARITLGGTEMIVIDLTRTGNTVNKHGIDFNITDSSTKGVNYIDLTANITGTGGKTGIGIDLTSGASSTGELYGYSVFTLSQNASAHTFGADFNAVSYAGAMATGVRIIAYDEAGQTACTLRGLDIGCVKNLAGSVAQVIYINAYGPETMNYGITFNGTFTDGIDTTSATMTNALKLAPAQKITTSGGTLKLGSGDGKVDFVDATVTGSTVTHDAYVELDVGGSTYKFMLGS